MVLNDYAIAGPPDMSAADFKGVLAAGQSPALVESDAIYNALVAGGIRPSVWLAFGTQESQLGKAGIVVKYATKNMGNVRSPEVASAGTIVQTERGPFAKYATWAKGAKDWAERMRGPKYAGSGLTTVRTVLRKYAPASDSNDPVAYGTTVLGLIETWTKGAPTVSVSKPPLNTSHPSPNRNGYGGARRVEALCWHVTAGAAGPSISWLCSPASSASSNYVIDKDGTIYELVPPDQDAWANGAVNQPDLGNAQIARWTREGANFNQRTISIENVRETSANNQPGGFTAAQRESLIALSAWLCERFGVPADRGHILRHAQIDSVNRPYCPGLAESEIVDWVGRIAARSKGGTMPSDPSESIGGALTPAHPEGYLSAGQPDTFLWPDGEGVITDRTVVYYNSDKRTYYRREWHNQTGYSDWEEVAS